ncbi:hypothetical protein Cantr_00216 [Candida viswanathii]|uniref:Uncharacterized protein n=1 Tax=Candida viswanathii TaxID=5486 RepID=A0A367YFK0_9ASCO|nr:hypothetical protein Cantr_00216 [Candida viswanathii]
MCDYVEGGCPIRKSTRRPTENLRKLRASLEAVRESTDKILKDVTTINKVNNPTLLQNSKDLQNALDKI